MSFRFLRADLFDLGALADKDGCHYRQFEFMTRLTPVVTISLFWPAAPMLAFSLRPPSISPAKRHSEGASPDAIRFQKMYWLERVEHDWMHLAALQGGQQGVRLMGQKRSDRQCTAFPRRAYRQPAAYRQFARDYRSRRYGGLLNSSLDRRNFASVQLSRLSASRSMKTFVAAQTKPDRGRSPMATDARLLP